MNEKNSSQKLDYGQQYDLQSRKTAHVKFLDIKTRLENGNRANFTKGKNSNGLAIFSQENSILIQDFTQKSHKIHEMTLYYDPKTKFFNLKKILGTEIQERNNISIASVMEVLNEVEQKMHYEKINQTQKEISSAITKIFSDEKKGFF